jgi:hypothetical protein
MGDFVRKKVTTFLVGLTMMLSVSVVFAQPASAQVFNISVTVTTTQCPYGGSVSRANVTIDTPGTSGTSTGDTVSGLQAFQNRNNLIHGSNFCKTTWYGGGYYWYWSVYRWISWSGQHTYV